MIGAAAVLAAVAAAGFALTLRLPLPFDGFAAVAAAGLAFLGTLSLTAWMPARWLWSDADRLRFAFQARHGIGAEAAEVTLQAITGAHDAAARLRRSGKAMRDDMAAEVGQVADRLDAAAREIFYVPDRRRALAKVLNRAALIVDAADAHARLRARKEATTEAASREKLRGALRALDAAFDDTDLAAARGLLHEVETASDVAETLLTPRRLSHSKPSQEG